jgi:hypothetical protein
MHTPWALKVGDDPLLPVKGFASFVIGVGKYQLYDDSKKSVTRSLDILYIT